VVCNITIDEEISMLNEECKKCLDFYEKEMIPFDDTRCSKCQTGAKLHKLLILQSKSEQKWADTDWNSSRWEEYYHT
jgi:hypothetical protein